MMLIGAGESRFRGVVLPLPFPVTVMALCDDGVDDDPAGLDIARHGFTQLGVFVALDQLRTDFLPPRVDQNSFHCSFLMSGHLCFNSSSLFSTFINFLFRPRRVFNSAEKKEVGGERRN